MSQEGIAGVRARLDAGDYVGAWHAALEQPSGRETWLARCEVLHRAGDPGAALAAAREGLRESPGDLDLLYWAASSSIWLSDGELASSFSERLGKRVEEAVPGLPPGDAGAWEGAVQDFRARSVALVEHARTLDASVQRARGLVGGVGFLLVLGLAWVSRQGRSRSPVS